MRTGKARASGRLGRVVLPLGRLLHMLGFRWVFWWTLPIPYHPLLAVALLLSPLVLLGWSAADLIRGQSATVSWTTLLAYGLLLGLPLSVPILNIMLFLFRVHLVQALCFLGGMSLLAAEVAMGGVEPIFAILSAAFFGAFLFKAVKTRVDLFRWRRNNAAFAPLPPQEGPVDLSGGQLWTEAMSLVDMGLAPVVRCDERDRTGSVSVAGHVLVRLPEGTGAPFKERLSKSMRPPGWLFVKDDILQFDSWPEPAGLSLSWDRMKGDGGARRLFTVDRGGTNQEVVVGKAAPTSLLPLFVLFYAVAFPQGRSRWMAGFAPSRARDLWPSPPFPKPREGARHLDNSYHDGRAWRLFEPRSGPAPAVDPVPLLARLEREQAFMMAEANRGLDDYLSGRGRWVPALQRFDHRPEHLSGRGQALCAALGRAKEDRDEHRAFNLAKLLAALPAASFAALERELIPLLGSRILALRWELTPDLDVSPLPRGCPKFGRHAGFGLMTKVPALWERLGELGPPAARITALFLKEVGEQPMLAKARERFAERGIDLPQV